MPTNRISMGSTSVGFSSSQANGGNYVDQNGDAEEAAPRVDAAHHLVEGPNDQTASGDHLGHCRYGTVRMHGIAVATRKTLSARFGV
jgi:hypothetical protein